MSGGYFDCSHHTIRDVAEKVSEWLDKNGEDLSDDTRAILMESDRVFQIASVYLNRVDLFLSGDDGEDAFKTRLREDLENL